MTMVVMSNNCIFPLIVFPLKLQILIIGFCESPPCNGTTSKYINKMNNGLLMKMSAFYSPSPDGKGVVVRVFLRYRGNEASPGAKLEDAIKTGSLDGLPVFNDYFSKCEHSS